MSSTSILEDRIRERAYALWDAAGKPEDQAERFWRQAEDEIRAEESGYDKTLRQLPRQRSPIRLRDRKRPQARTDELTPWYWAATRAA